MVTTYLFDLDGTLLPMDQEVFVTSYFKLLAAKVAERGYAPEALVSGIWAGTAAMVQNDGSCTNEEAFWKRFSGIFGDRVLEDKHIFEEFYRIEFNEVAKVCGSSPMAAEVVEQLKGRGCRLVLATNPIFPEIATRNRIAWAGLQPEDFELITTYENCRYCKPNPAYYRELLDRIGCVPEECAMVGNDVEEDMVAETLGMKVFLLTDCIINKGNIDISAYPHGGFKELLHWQP